MSLSASELSSHDPSGPDVEEETSAIAGLSPSKLAVRRFRKDTLSMITLGVVLLYLLAAVAAPFLKSAGVLDPFTFHQDLLDISQGGLPKGSWGGASGDHPLGIEPGTGRDVLSRLALGLTYSLTIALAATVLTISFGAVVGIIAGFRGGWIDAIIGRLVDLTLSFPQTLILLALSGMAVLAIRKELGIDNADLANGIYVVVVLAAFGWPPICRVVRGQVLSLREREFVEAARLMGASKARIYFKEILPNLWAPLLVYFTLTMPAYISAEAALSYLGVGIAPPSPTLGNILKYSINYSVTDPVFFFGPAVLLAIIVISFNLLGDGIRDALDPKADR